MIAFNRLLRHRRCAPFSLTAIRCQPLGPQSIAVNPLSHSPPHTSAADNGKQSSTAGWHGQPGRARGVQELSAVAREILEDATSNAAALTAAASASSPARSAGDAFDRRGQAPVSTHAARASPEEQQASAAGMNRANDGAEEWSLQRVDTVLARHGLLASLGAPASARSAALGHLTDTEKTEIRDLLDFLTQKQAAPAALHAQQHQRDHRVRTACRLAYSVGLHSRCCELFFAYVDAQGKPLLSAAPLPPPSSTAVAGGFRSVDRLPEYIIYAAAAGKDTAALTRCVALAEDTHASSTLREPRQTIEASRWQATAGVILALRTYSCCVELYAALPSSGAGALQRDVRAVARRAGVLLCLPEHNFDSFLAASVRLVRYTGGTNVPGSLTQDANKRSHAAIGLQVFRLWCKTGAKRGLSAASWLTPTCLHSLMRAASDAQRWDMASFYSLYTDLYFKATQQLMSLDTEATLTLADDALIGAVLRYHVLSRQHASGLRWLAKMRAAFPAYLPSVSVGNVIARLAGETAGDARLALWCLELFLDPRQPVPPTPAELFSCLCALARSGISSFWTVVTSMVDNELLSLTEEEALFLKLLHCRGGTRWREQLDELLQTSVDPSVNISATLAAPVDNDDGTRPLFLSSLTEAGVVHGEGSNAQNKSLRALFSSRNICTSLLVMQEGEHPQFAAYYRFFLRRFASSTTVAERARWSIFAVVWATSRAGKVLTEDVVFIAREACQLLCDAPLADLTVADSSPLASRTSERVSPSRVSSTRTEHIPNAVRHSLETKWAVLYAQHSAQWWNEELRWRSTSSDRRWSSSRNAPAATRLSIMPLAPPAAALPAFPVARFLKRKEKLRLSAAPRGLLAQSLCTSEYDIVSRSPSWPPRGTEEGSRPWTAAWL